MEADHMAQDEPEGSGEVKEEDPGNWRNRLRLKQVAVQLPVIQNIDEGYGAEESEDAQEKNKAQTARKSFKKPPLRSQDATPGPVISGKILRFSCSECIGPATFSPNDLLKHFQGVHQGSLPTFPCDMCSFVTHDFSSLQRHRIGHRDTFVRCDICSDGIQYTLLQLTRHFNMFHSLNGYYRCEKCKFSTKDVGTFVQHTHRHNDALYKCSKCQHISHGSGEHQKHIMSHSGTNPFSCQFCDYGAPRKDYVAKHMAVVHGEEMDRLNKRRASEDGQKTLVNSTPGLKLLLTKNPARQTHWMSKGLHALSGGGLLDEYGRLANPEKTLEETQQFLERTVAAQRDCKKWAKALKSEQHYTSQTDPAMSQPKQEPAVPPSTSFLNSNSNGLTVLMVKNKITIPPNCTTKVMGFKMVDGKKHLVLKVIPSTKQEPSVKTQESLVTTAMASASPGAKNEADGNALDSCKGEAYSLASSKEETAPPSGLLVSSDSKLSPNPKVSPNGVTPLGSSCSLPPKRESSDIASTSEQMQAQKNGEQDHELLPKTGGEVEEEQLPGMTEKDKDTASPPPSPTANGIVSPTNVVVEQSSLTGLEDDCSPSGETSLIPVATDLILENKTPKHTDPDESDPAPYCLENTTIESMSNNSPLSSPSQEIFNFHNYSKDTSSLSSDVSLIGDEQQQSSQLEPETVEPEYDGCHILEPSNDRNMAPESSPLQQLHDLQKDQDKIVEACADLAGQRPLDSDHSSMEKVPDNEIEVDECVATVEDEGDSQESEVKCQTLDSPEGLKITPEAHFQCQEQCPAPISNEVCAQTEKGEEHRDPLSESLDHTEKNVEGPNLAGGEKASGSSNNAAILGKILEEHSDAIISQQLERERIGTTAAHEAVRTPTTTLRILQPLNLSDGKQQVFLQAAENGYTLPVQLRGSPGFKLITGSVPPINVSYLKPGGERPSNRTAALTFTLSNGRIGTAAQLLGDKEAGGGLAKGGEQDSTALSPTALQGAGTSTSSFLVNGSPLKGPLFFSSPIQSLSKERTVNPPTCYLVQRPVAIASAATKPSTGPVSAAGSVQTPQSKSVLALPVNSSDQPTVLQAGRQAFLLRYVSPVKSGILLNSPEGKTVNQNSLTNDSGGSRVFLKIVRNSSDTSLPSCSGVAGGGFMAQTHANQPIYLATTGGLQSPYLLMSSNQSILNVSTGTNNSESSQESAETLAMASPFLSFSSIAPTVGKASEKQRGEVLSRKLKKAQLPSPRRNQQGAKRKRPRKSSMEDSLEPPAKARRLSSKKAKEKETPAVAYWEPAPREVERMLRLQPLSPVQPVKCPRRNQPVVVLNHPDADIPEVASLMRTVNKFRGKVTRVALSQRTVDALSELDCDTFRQDPSADCHARHGRRIRPEGTVRERFILKLRLKKTSRNKYKVVNASSDSTEWSSKFSCWFCGRIFDNQEEWIGHGQRHLMEATRDWNKLFS